MALHFSKSLATNKFHSCRINTFRFFNVPIIFRKPFKNIERSLDLCYQDILSKKLLNSDMKQSELFLKALSANLKANLSHEKLDVSKLEHLLEYSGLKEVGLKEWIELHKSNFSFAPEVNIKGYSTLKLYMGRRKGGWGWEGESGCVVVVYVTKDQKDLHMRMFKNVEDKHISNTIHKSETEGWLVDRLLFSTTMGLSLGSISSTILLNLLHLPSTTITTTAITSTLLACFLHKRLCNSQINLLQRQSQVLFEKAYADTKTCLHDLVDKEFNHLYPSLLTLYTALHHLSTSSEGQMEAGENLRNKVSAWVEMELGAILPPDFKMEYLMEMMVGLGMARVVNKGVVEVVPFETALQTLSKLPPPSKYLSERSNYTSD